MPIGGERVESLNGKMVGSRLVECPPSCYAKPLWSTRLESAGWTEEVWEGSPKRAYHSGQGVRNWRLVTGLRLGLARRSFHVL